MHRVNLHDAFTLGAFDMKGIVLVLERVVVRLIQDSHVEGFVIP
jgi:hypothetical protein